MRYVSLVIATLLLGYVAWANQKPSVEELQTKINSAHGGKKASLLMQLARIQVEQADHLYHDGETDQALRTINSASAHADQATQVSLESGKRLKDTEIDLRKLSERMQSLRQELSFDERQLLDGAIQNVEQDRTKLLDRMFKR